MRVLFFLSLKKKNTFCALQNIETAECVWYNISVIKSLLSKAKSIVGFYVEFTLRYNLLQSNSIKNVISPTIWLTLGVEFW